MEGIFLIAQTSVKIGTQIWTTNYLNVDKFSNGDAIKQAKTVEEWVKLCRIEEPAWCYANFDSIKNKDYGFTYNWYAINDQRGLAPIGWHIPSSKEWTVLLTYLGGIRSASFKMKTTNGWHSNGNGDNSSGFNAFPIHPVETQTNGGVQRNLTLKMLGEFPYHLAMILVVNATGKTSPSAVRCIKN